MTTELTPLFYLQYREDLDMYHLFFRPSQGAFLLGDYPTERDGKEAMGVYESVYLRAKADGIELALTDPDVAKAELEKYR